MDGTVYIEAEWQRPSSRSDPPRVLSQDISLRRDVLPGEILEQRVLLSTPQEPGEYVVALRLRQRRGAAFRDDETSPTRLEVRVEPERPHE